MTEPFPIPRQLRQTDVFVGNGGATYSGFNFKIFDIDDVEVWTKTAYETAFSKQAVAVIKLNNQPLDDFSVTFSVGQPATTAIVVRSARLAERTAGVDNGTKIGMYALEKELSKQATVQQEVRRDLGRTVMSDFGEDGMTIDGGIADGRTLMKQGDRLVEGPDIVAEADRAEAARDLAEGYASDAISQGNVPVYSTIDGMPAINVPAGIIAVQVNGKSSAGDGLGGRFVKIDSDPGATIDAVGKFRSGDGRWWLRKPFENLVYEKEIELSNIPGLDTVGATDSSVTVLALQAEHAASGFVMKLPQSSKIRLDQNLALNFGQKIRGSLNPNDATGASFNYANIGSTFILGGGATIRLDNGAVIENSLVYRRGLVFNADQGDFSSWAGAGITLGYGNDQVVRNVMSLGFLYGVRSLNDRGLNGPGRIVLDRVYVDAVNAFYLSGSYDTAFIDKIRAFCFVTQAYAGNPAPGESYDPRKDRRPGTGLKLVDRADGTKIMSAEIFGYKTGIDANTASWMIGDITVDYPTTTTYNTGGGSGVIGALLHADTDPTVPRAVDYDPSQIGNLQIWSVETGLKIVGNAGRVSQIATLAIRNTYGDAIQIDGGGLIAPNTTIENCTGTPVRFLSAPNTKSIIRGKATHFGAARNSSGVPAVKLPALSSANLVDVKLNTDQSAGSGYFDNHPALLGVASGNPLNLPAYNGGEVETFFVTGSNNLAGIYGPRPGRVRLFFENAITIFAASEDGGIRLPGGAASLNVTTNTCLTLEYNGTAKRWCVVSVT
ncbi:MULTISPECIES: hypothetical protein [unclassified Rhizobium]|uniref:hypothetical protein n=1 Tax=unclassified Rhizobium TaxID=2613769 RepID=UPI00161A32AF|nr:MULTISPECIES: hypothetical protein [unclassified Rhizobium]MBB3385981.1 hypothetical protein [Rhizobium sp. BK098]MBB3617841.1 hypothetical protein [Rhizobium sp. BK609]MBB3683343.1 hypothetical protein [Rhizobium sp. BK612]